MGDIDRQNRADKLDLLRAPYFFSGLRNEKFFNSLSKYYEEKNYEFGNVIFEWGKIPDRIYFVKEGVVKLQRKKNPRDDRIQTLKKKLGLIQEDEKRTIKLVSESLTTERNYDEIAIKEAKQCFAEEYFFIRKPAVYRAVVASSHAKIATIKFESIKLTFQTYEMYYDEVRHSILERFKDQGIWRNEIDEALRRKDIQTNETTEKDTERAIKAGLIDPLDSNRVYINVLLGYSS